MILASFAEVLSIGAVIPFLAVLTTPEKVLNSEILTPILGMLQIGSRDDLLLPFTTIFILSAITAGLLRISLLWAQTRLSTIIGAELSIQCFERSLYQDYSVHISRNSSEILAGTQKANALVSSLIQPTLTIISSTFILTSLMVMFFIVEPFVSTGIIISLGIIYYAIVRLSRSQIQRNSKAIADGRTSVAKAVQEGLGGIRDVILDGSQRFYTKLYSSALVPMQHAIANTQIVSESPRYAIESLGIVLISVVAYVLQTSSVSETGIVGAIPILGALALGAQRMLPLVQQIFYAYITLKSSEVSNRDALDLLDQRMPSQNYFEEKTPLALPFDKRIKLQNVGFRHPNGPWVLRRVNIEIPKGSRVGFIGKTGAGKSTLLDIIMALLVPSEGSLYLDNEILSMRNRRAWQEKIAHVPQSIFISDSSVAQNIALGLSPSRIDVEWLKKVCVLASISQTIEALPNRYDTILGERGVRLSGGQLQRIGFARALYRRASVLVLDEATSSLDTQTESYIMESLNQLDRDITILIVAHRTSTLKACDLIFEVLGPEVKPLDGQIS